MPISLPDTTFILDSRDQGHGRLFKHVLETAHASRQTELIAGKASLGNPLPPGVDLVFVVLNDDVLGLTDDQSLDNLTPSQELSRIWELTGQLRCPVHAVVPTDRLGQGPYQITPLDILAICGSGVDGVWASDATMLADRQLHDYVMMLEMYSRTRHVVLYGEAANVVVRFVKKISASDWPTDKEVPIGKDQTIGEPMKRACFQVAAAVATLSVEEFTLANPRGNGTHKYVEKLQEHNRRTGLAYSKHVLEDALNYLERMWSDDIGRNYSVKRKREMPEFARGDGFSRHLPPVKGVLPLLVSSELFDIVHSVVLDPDWNKEKGSVLTISFHGR